VLACSPSPASRSSSLWHRHLDRLSWLVGILIVAYTFAMVTNRRKIA